LLTAALCLGALGLNAATAQAKDALVSAASIPDGQPVPIMTANGSGYTPGTYAIGTIVLNYTYVGTSLPAGLFATFNLNLSVHDASGKNEPSYPVQLTLEDIGSKHLTLVPAASPLMMTGLGWSHASHVSIFIPAEVAGNPEFTVDGAQIVGNLRMTTPGGSQVDTDTNVLVKITLVHPTGPCLKVYPFITNASLTDTLDATDVNVNKHGKVTATNPHGSLSSNALIVNTCGAPVTFDLKMALDGAFSTQPSNNPGNAVFTFATAGEVDPANFDIASFGVGTPQGQKLCLQNVTVPDGSSFLDAVHMSINNGMVQSGLPVDGTFDFSTTVYLPGTACSGQLLAEAGIEPFGILVPFSIK
jgi:hypothetical protein